MATKSLQILGSLNQTAVQFVEQELTEEEKAQARENIGAAGLDADGKVPLEQLPDDIGGLTEVDWETNVVNKPFGIIGNSIAILESQSKATTDLTDTFEMPFYGFYETIGDTSMTLDSFYNEIQVSYDGVIYNLTKLDDADVGIYYFGNGSLFNAVFGSNFSDTGEPFVVGLMTEEADDTVTGYLFITNDTQDATHTVSISIVSEIVKALDIKYLPENMALGYESKSFEDVIWNGNIDGLPILTQEVDIEGAPFVISYIKVSDIFISKESVLGGEILGYNFGDIQTITIDNSCISNETTSGSYWVDLYVANIAIDNDVTVMPELELEFVFPSAGTWVLLAKTDGEVGIQFQHLKSGVAITPIDEKFIPDTIARKSELNVINYKFSDYYSKSEINHALNNINVDLSDYYTKSETYSKDEIDQQHTNMNINILNCYNKYQTYSRDEIDAALQNVSVDLSEYYTKTETYNKSEIDESLDNISVDLSDYYTKSEAYNKSEIDSLLGDVSTVLDEISALIGE